MSLCVGSLILLFICYALHKKLKGHFTERSLYEVAITLFCVLCFRLMCACISLCLTVCPPCLCGEGRRGGERGVGRGRGGVVFLYGCACVSMCVCMCKLHYMLAYMYFCADGCAFSAYAGHSQSRIFKITNFERHFIIFRSNIVGIGRQLFAYKYASNGSFSHILKLIILHIV